MYRVLYRKWRPEKFSDVIGQQHVTTTLRNEIRSGRISHAYLFTGSRGTGKTSCAKILSRAVNCLDVQDGEPCGKCACCVGISNGSILDVVEMDAASNNSVNDIRDVLNEVVYTPSDTKYRVYIIDEVHMLSSGAYNALLKTLEEPPPHVVFILATTEINKIPATILSRCQRFDFNRIDARDMARRLVEVAGEENVSLSDDAAMLISAVADGAMRDALSILDRCIGLSSSVTPEVVREATGLAGRDYLFTLADAVMNGSVVTAINTVNELHKASKSMPLLCDELSEHFRALMLLKTMKRQADGLVLMTKEEIERAEKQAEGIDLSRIVSCIETLQKSRELMFKGGNNKIEFETCMIKLCSPRLSSDMGAVLARLEKLERSFAASPAPQRQNTSQSIPQSIPTETGNISQGIPQTAGQTVQKSAPSVSQPANVNTSHAPTPPVQTASPPKNVNPQNMSPAEKINWLCSRAVPFEPWEDVLEDLKTKTRVTAAAFKGTTAYVADNYVLIYSEDDTVMRYLKNAAYREKIKASIEDTTGRKYQLGPYRPQGSVQNAQPEKKSRLESFIDNISNSDIKITVDDQ